MVTSPAFSGPGRIEISVGVPSILMQIMNGKLLQRMLTLTPFSEFYDAKGVDKLKIVAKTTAVGLIALGIAAAVALMSSLTIYAVPLCLIVTMGLAFNFLNEEAALARQNLKEVALQSLATGKTVKVKPDVIVIE